MNICIVVGHTKVKYGAESKKYGVHEYDYNCILAKKIKVIAESKKHICYVIYKDNFLTGKDIADKINSYQYDCVLELHCNAFDKQAKGTETLYAKNLPEHYKLASIVQSEVSKVFNRQGLLNRGAKLLKEGDRGYFNLVENNYPSVIVEPFFIDNDDDCAIGLGNVDKLAECLFNCCTKFEYSK